MLKSMRAKMLKLIGANFPVKVWKAGSAFETLIETILSQNTNDRNSGAAMKRLRKHYKINPRTLAKANPRSLIPYIRQAGLYHTKAPRIVEVSRIIQKQYGGRLTQVLNQPYEKAKQELMNLPGVGPKTADILLAFVAKNPVIPVDTHIARVSKRLGIASPKASYEEVRTSLQSVIPPRRRVSLHLSMIEFGRAICRAPRPRCAACPVNKLCPSSTA